MGRRSIPGLDVVKDVMSEPLLAVWSLFILLVPFKIVHSGLPQPADALMVLFVPVVAMKWKGRFDKRSRATSRALLAFTVWVCVVTLAWSTILSLWDGSTLIPFYYIYNAMVFWVVTALFAMFGDRFIRTTLYATFAITLFQVASTFFLKLGGLRASLFYNNSNQLGYYALIAACLIAVTSRRVRFGLLNSGIGLTACGYLALLAASRAALIGIVVLFALLMLSNPRVVLIGGLVGMALALFNGDAVSHAFEGAEYRMTNDRAPNETFFEERGYDRIWNNKAYLIAGAAEGHAERFYDDKDGRYREIHSSAGTILFSYGVIGFVIFGVFLWRVIRGARGRFALMLLPPLLYSVAHQGLRFSLLWVFFAIFAQLKRAPAGVRPAKVQARAPLIAAPSRM